MDSNHIEISLRIDTRMIYIFAILLAICQCFYQRYQFNDLKWERDIRWKYWRIITTSVTFIMVFLAQFVTFLWVDLLLASAIYWIVFEVGTNVISLSADWLYVGMSSFTDNKIGKYKWYLMALFLLISLLLKHII